LKESKINIKEINLHDNELDDDCIESLGEFIQNSKTIKNIDISYNKIIDKSIEILFPYLIGNITIKYFGINYNKGITDKSISLLKEIIHKSSIEDIKIKGTLIINQNILVVPLIGNMLKNGSDNINMNWR